MYAYLSYYIFTEKKINSQKLKSEKETTVELSKSSFSKEFYNCEVYYFEKKIIFMWVFLY